MSSKIRRIALVGNNPPRLCGIATFTADLHSALRDAFPEIAIDVYAMNEAGITRDYPPEVVYAIDQDKLSDYQTAAQRINASRADIVLVQHEYGIFGGAAGSYLLKLLDRVEAPVVVTLHTVLENPTPEQRMVLEALVRRATRIIVMADRGRDMLERVHGVDRKRIVVIPHGVPDRALIDPETIKPRFGFGGRRVLLTFGLLSPNKGIETMIRAMPAISAAYPDVLYVVLGATHPHLVAHEGEAYRDRLMALAAELGVADHVRFIDGFVEQDLLLDYLAAADIYVTPYLNEAQITSGTLSYAVGLGKPVVSTPYWHAAELLPASGGTLVSFHDSAAFAAAIDTMLGDPVRLQAMREKAWQVGRGMTWAKLAEGYGVIFREAARHRPVRLARGHAGRYDLVPARLDAVERLSDACGMLQHAIFSVPDRDHGYCVDDNCRALMLMHRVDGEDQARADQLATIYASFVQHAWNGDNGRFRNFMGFDRNWLENVGSEDSFGRSLWSIGVTAAEARNHELRRWAVHLFDQVAPNVRELRYLRSQAFAILGADALLDAYPGHALARSILTDFGPRLLDALMTTRRDGWNWFEPTLGYDNARLPEALIRAGIRLGDNVMEAAGFDALEWLDGIQTNGDGQFRAVGTDSFGRFFEPPLPFDQQPLEAWATIDAALVAWSITGEERWQACAWRAWRWYLGDNDIGVPIATPTDGGCFDGLMSDRANLNQGAESILSFQFACRAMRKMVKTAETSGVERTAGTVP